MKKIDKKKQVKVFGLIALAAVALTITLISFQGTNFMGGLTLKPSALRDLSPLSGEPGPYSGEPVVGRTVNKAELAKLIVATLNVDASSYKGCAPDVIGQWYESYACYMVSRKAMGLATDGLFHGEESLTRSQGAKVFAISFVKPADWYAGTQVIFKDVMTTDWFYVYTMTLAQRKVLDVEPILPNQPPTLTLDKSKGVFSPHTYLTQKAATVWAQNAKTNILN